MRRPWKVRPVLPVCRARSYSDEAVASDAAHRLGHRYGVEFVIIHASTGTTYGVVPLEFGEPGTSSVDRWPMSRTPALVGREGT